jgi:hypothetical protein
MRKKKNETSEERNTEAREIWLDENTLNEISSDTSTNDDDNETMDDDEE